MSTYLYFPKGPFLGKSFPWLHGQPKVSPCEIKTLCSAAMATRKRIVEIGVFDGCTSAIFLLYSQDSVEVVGIDPIVTPDPNAEKGSLEQIKRNTDAYGARYRFIQDYSFNAVKGFSDPIGLLFIDGDHSYEAVKKDFVDWAPLVEVGGRIYFHDTGSTRGGPLWRPETTKFTDQLIEGSEKLGLMFLGTSCSLSMFQKVEHVNLVSAMGDGFQLCA